MNLCNTEFDNQFNLIDNLCWKPWVGINYSLTTTTKLLIIGESHYCWSDNKSELKEIIEKITNRGFTRSIIHQFGVYAKNNSTQPLFRNLEKTIFNSEKIASPKQKRFWHSVSFYNFIQRPLISRAKEHRPNTQDWITGWNTFSNVVHILNPDLILFCGVEALNQEFIITKEFQKGNLLYKKKVIKTKNKIGNTYIRTIGILQNNFEKEISVICIDHPSSFFSWKKWHQIIKKKIGEFHKLFDEQI